MRTCQLPRRHQRHREWSDFPAATACCTLSLSAQHHELCRFGVFVGTDAAVYGRADVPTSGLDLRQDMPYLEAFQEVVLALFATVHNIKRAVCFGTQALKVWYPLTSQMLGVCGACCSFFRVSQQIATSFVS